MIKITQFTVEHLTGCLPYSVSGEIPANPPAAYVVVEKKGSGIKDHIAESTICLSCYADTLAHAEDLSQEVQTAMESMIYLPEISALEFGGDYNATDTTKKQYCFDVIYHITHY